MPEKPSDLVQGTLDMLILKTLALEPTHGYGISVRIEQMSKGVFRLNAGSLFLAIQRLERDGLIEGEWKTTENNRRAKYYVLTQKGRKRLNNETREWGRQVAAIARILEASRGVCYVLAPTCCTWAQVPFPKGAGGQAIARRTGGILGDGSRRKDEGRLEPERGAAGRAFG